MPPELPPEGLPLSEPELELDPEPGLDPEPVLGLGAELEPPLAPPLAAASFAPPLDDPPLAPASEAPPLASDFAFCW